MIITNEQRNEKSGNSDISIIIRLYKKLLEIIETEQLEIAKCNIAGIERCFSLKKILISELESLSNCKPCSSPYGSSGSILTEITASLEQRAEIESLIKKIAVINEANAKAVLHLKNKVADEIFALKNENAAFRAYRAYA